MALVTKESAQPKVKDVAKLLVNDPPVWASIRTFFVKTAEETITCASKKKSSAFLPSPSPSGLRSSTSRSAGNPHNRFSMASKHT